MTRGPPKYLYELWTWSSQRHFMKFISFHNASDDISYKGDNRGPAWSDWRHNGSPHWILHPQRS